MIRLSLNEEFLPIPIHVQPSPWEDIASLISRVAAQMGYASPLWVLSPEQYEYAVSARSLTTLSKAADYQFLVGPGRRPATSVSARPLARSRRSGARCALPRFHGRQRE